MMQDRNNRTGICHRWWMVILLWSVMGSVAAQERHHDGIDNVLQYVPYTTVIGLKVCGVESRDDWTTLLAATAGSWLVSAGVAYTLKHSVREWRPDQSDRRSFPSGHATFAFAGARMLHLEYGQTSPWISVAGYGVAALTAVDRVIKDRHHWYDVVAGAGIGVLSAELSYRLCHKWLKTDKVELAFSGNRLDVALRW